MRGRWIPPVLVLLVASACDRAAPPTPVDQSIRPAKLERVADNAALLTQRFVGRVEALQTVDMSFEVAGPLAELPIREGQEVAKGALVAALDPTDFRLAVREAEVQVKIARQDLDRKQGLLQQRGIARSVVDDARALYELQLVRLDQARQRLADSRLEAPFDAYVAERYVDNFVKLANGARVARLHDLSRLLVVANVPEALLATSTPEQLVSLDAAFDFLPNQTFPLEIYENRGDSSGVAQTFAVSFVMVPPEEWNILPGMTATVTARLKDASGDSAIIVPADALVAEGSDFMVWVYDEETGLVEKRPVAVGEPRLDGVPVLSGLVSGEQIVTTGADRLKAGMRVRPLD